MVYRKKERIKKKIELLLGESDKLNVITKTRFINKLEKIKIDKSDLHLKNVLSYIFSDLEGKDVEHLREKIQKRAEEVMNLVDKAEEKIIKNILKKVKHTYTVLTTEKNPLLPQLLNITKNKNIKINFVTSLKDKKVNFEHIDLALVHIDRIDSHANIFTNKDSVQLIKKAKELDIPVYCYTHSLNYTPKIKKKSIIKPNLVKSIISEIGIFEPEIFVQELKLNYPWLVK